MKQQKPKTLQCELWWQWILATVGAFGLSLFWLEIGEKTELGAIEGLIGGLIIGTIQAIVFRQRLPYAGLWVLVNLISWGILGGSGLGAIGWFAPSSYLLKVRLYYGAILGFMGGLWLGSWQCLVLKQPFSLSWQWIGISALSWSLGLAAGWTVGGVLRGMTDLFMAEVIGLALTWIIVAISTGFAWMKLLSS